MKRVIILKNINSSWGVQNRVETMQEWAATGAAPFEIDVDGDNATIVISNEARNRYENPYQYDNDLSLANNFINDIKDPLSGGDGFEFKDIDIEKCSEQERKDLVTFANENCSMLSAEYLQILGLEVDIKRFEPEPIMNESDRMAALNKLISNESIEDAEVVETPVTSETKPEEVTSAVLNNVSNTAKVEEKPAPAPVYDPAMVNAFKDVNIPEFVTFVKEMMEACDKHNITAAGVIEALMAIKALANASAVAKPASDITGEEDYNYTNAVPYLENPNDKGETPQSTNVESVNNNNNVTENTTISTESVEPTPVTPEDIYGNLINDYNGTIFEVDDISMEGINDMADIIPDGVSFEAFLSSRATTKSDNQVIDDMKKICEDAKKIAEKAFRELRDNNKEIFEKYGAFIKLLNDIVDAVFMDKRYIKLEIAKFDVKKANNDLVPDELETKIIKQFGSSAISSALGPFAGLAKTEDKPGTFLLACANKLRKEILPHIRKAISKYGKASLTLVEDELKGSYVLTLAFAPLEVSNESIVEEPKKYDNLMEQLAHESVGDDDFFNKVMANMDSFTYESIMECAEYNMRHYYLTGNKVPNNPMTAAMRRTEYFRNAD